MELLQALEVALHPLVVIGDLFQFRGLSLDLVPVLGRGTPHLFQSVDRLLYYAGIALNKRHGLIEVGLDLPLNSLNFIKQFSLGHILMNVRCQFFILMGKVL